MKNLLKFSFWVAIFVLLTSSCNNKNKTSKQPTKTYALESGYYTEKYRPQFHFSPEANWMNDPNGLVYLNGEYHLFYQYYPDSTVWGPMHWGHAVSTDLIHWNHLPIALYPDTLGYIFSGSAVVDLNNTSGFGSDRQLPVVAIFTYHNPVLEKKGSNLFQNQGIAFSNDKGRTWTKYRGNPVIKNPGIRDFRDPKMFWNPESGKWDLIMAVKDRVHIYSSPDLKTWTFESEFGSNAGAHGGVWECPDLFKLSVEESDIMKWVMLVSINPGGPNGGSSTQYFTGEFDGHRFIPDETGVKWIDWGRDNYAGVTWSNIPKIDGRKIFIGWMSNWDYATVVPTSPWRSSSTIPRELSLGHENGHFFLKSRPVREFGDIRIKADTVSVKHLFLTGDKEISHGRVSLMQSEMLFDFDMSDKKIDSIGVILEDSLNERVVIGYSTIGKKIFVDRRAAGVSDFSNKFAGVSEAPYLPVKSLKLHLFVDASSLELFVDDGRMVMTNLIFPTTKYTRLRIYSKGGNALLNKAMLYSLARIWPSARK